MTKINENSYIGNSGKQLKNLLGNMQSSPLNNVSIPNNQSGVVGSMTLQPGKYIIQGTLHAFPTINSKWIQLYNATDNGVIANQNLDSVYGGTVVAFVNIVHPTLIQFSILNYSGTQIDYTVYFADQFEAIRIA